MSIKKTSHPALSWGNALIQEWFLTKVGTPSSPQELGWPSILSGKHTLISAPTGSGKTLAAFLASLNKLVEQSLQGKLKDCTEVLYISPLKALSNDIQKNLLKPLTEITALAESKGSHLSPIRIAVRTGDTPTKERQAMVKKNPHILVTTPESLYILLTVEKSRLMLANVKTVIIDEIHAILNDKRGAHLALSLERLQALTPIAPLRIGLSATQKPIEAVAAFLVGTNRPLPNIINIGHERKMELAVEVPGSELGAVASNEMWDEIYDRLAELARENRSTLIFVNTRRLAERVAHHLTERLGESQVTAHHGSLSRKLRLLAEMKLKNGELKALVATGSLELGIDIGTVDLVCLIGSPRAISIALQRIGRAGHWHGAISKGRIFATTRDELLECASLVQAIRMGVLDQLIIPEQPLDVLAQQITATCATGDWPQDALFELVKSAYPYRNLTQTVFESIILMLAEGVTGSRGRYGAYLFHDSINRLLKARRGSRLTAITNGGAIPDTALFTVLSEPHATLVGTLDEDFAIESNRGDIILLGTASWRIKRIEAASGRVLVEDAHGAPPSVPFWLGEAPARTRELSSHIAALRQTISDLLPIKEFPSDQKLTDEHLPKPEREAITTALNWLYKQCGVDQAGAEQIIAYILAGRKILGAIPTQETVIAERFFDESGGMQLIIHAPFGARINKAWGLALRKRFCRAFNFELQAAATDNGISIALTDQHSFPLADVFQFLHPNTLKDVLIQAILQSPLYATRWRWVATRSLAVKRFRSGKKTPPQILRMLADDLLAAVFPQAQACQDNLAGQEIALPNHPLTQEAMKEALTEAMDLQGLAGIIKNILEGKIKCLAIDTPLPSPFAHEILNANPYAFLDDAPLEERRTRAVEMRRILPDSILETVGKLDKAAILEVQQQAWPELRSADELQDALQMLIALPQAFHLNEVQAVTPTWCHFFETLQTMGRVGMANYQNQCFWFAIEKTKTFFTIYPNAQSIFPLNNLDQSPSVSREEALQALVRGFLIHTGPITSRILSQALILPISEIDQVLLTLEKCGLILRGHFTTTKELEWCERRLLSRIHRLTVGRLRNEIAPVSAALFVRWLLQWQHVTPTTQLVGEKGLLTILKQLQGFEMPANIWEKHILAKRVKDYRPAMLDKLCFSGAVGWGRLSPHPIMEQSISGPHASNIKRIIPNSIAPITFFVREEQAWMPVQKVYDYDFSRLTNAAQQIYIFLKDNGASFLPEIIAGTNLLLAHLENALWELVAAGLITADGFDNLRCFIDRKRRLGSKRRRPLRYHAGRWSLLRKGNTLEEHERITAICWLLLKRYGVIFRDLLVKEKNLPRWRELLIALRRLEDKGEIRGGRFVSGFLGEQFALPYAVPSLRAIKNMTCANETVTLSALDPLNLVGIILPGPKIGAFVKKTVTLQDGVPLVDNIDNIKKFSLMTAHEREKRLAN